MYFKIDSITKLKQFLCENEEYDYIKDYFPKIFKKEVKKLILSSIVENEQVEEQYSIDNYKKVTIKCYEMIKLKNKKKNAFFQSNVLLREVVLDIEAIRSGSYDEID